MWDDLSAVDRQFAYLGERSRYVRFPLGGIGAGGFSISGSAMKDSLILYLFAWDRSSQLRFSGYSSRAFYAGEIRNSRAMQRGRGT